MKTSMYSLLIICCLASVCQGQSIQTRVGNTPRKDNRPVYVFYTSDIMLGSSFAPRTIKIISKPMLFDGQRSTQQAGKTRFVQQVKEILPKLIANDEHVRTDAPSVASRHIVRIDNAEELDQRVEIIVKKLPVYIHYNYLVNDIKKTARSEQECYQAIQYHKAFVMKALADINESTEFLQL